jgi:Ca-activated chloride channel family protein
MNSLGFAYPAVLALLALLPVLHLLRGRQGPGPAVLFSSPSVAAMIGASNRTRPGRLANLLRLLVLALLILALARPQYGNSRVIVESSGIDILLVVDVSGSMEARDFTLNGGSASRLMVVKKVVADFVSKRPGDRIGLLAFAGRPYLLCPLTLDHDWLSRRLESLRTGMIEDGTAIGSAIAIGADRLGKSRAKSRIMILLTDGINNAGKITPLIAAEAAQALGIKIYTVGVGTRGEAPMPMKDRFGRMRMGRVRVDIDEKTLQKVAEMTGARYFRATDTRSLATIYEEIDKLEKTTRKIRHFSMYRDLYAYPVAGALLLFALELMVRRKELP